jgi:hypothetical protein
MILRTMIIRTLAVCALLGSAAGAGAAPAAQESTACAPAGDLHFVCGVVNVEDFLPVDGGRWLVGSSLKPGSVGLYLIDTSAKTAAPVALSIAATPDPTYAGCAAPDLKALSTHGLDVVAGRHGVTTVLAINHGGRESVEVFHLQPKHTAAEWVGCVVLPPGANGNSIVALPHASFAVTKFLDTNDKQAFQHIMAGEINGLVYLWQPGKGFSEVPGTALSGDNGIAASPDGKWLFVNAYGTREIYRVPLSGEGERTKVSVDFHPDNLRWAPDGKLFVTGQYIDPQSRGAPDPWATVRLDPRTMAVTEVVKEPGWPEFGDATSTVQVGKTLWFGTFRGDRIAYRPAPH